MRLLCILLVLSLCGCSATQLRQEFIGYSMNDVINSKSKQVQKFGIGSADCIEKIKASLARMQAIVREDAEGQYLLVDNLQHAFRSTIDTTQVGIVITADGADKCLVEIASNNPDLAVFVSKEISKDLNPEPEEKVVKNNFEMKGNI